MKRWQNWAKAPKQKTLSLWPTILRSRISICPSWIASSTRTPLLLFPISNNVLPLTSQACWKSRARAIPSSNDTTMSMRCRRSKPIAISEPSWERSTTWNLHPRSKVAGLLSCPASIDHVFSLMQTTHYHCIMGKGSRVRLVLGWIWRLCWTFYQWPSVVWMHSYLQTPSQSHLSSVTLSEVLLSCVFRQWARSLSRDRPHGRPSMHRRPTEVRSFGWWLFLILRIPSRWHWHVPCSFEWVLRSILWLSLRIVRFLCFLRWCVRWDWHAVRPIFGGNLMLPCLFRS